MRIYTDGGCKKNGVGSWAFVILGDHDTILIQKSGFHIRTTNQKMEMEACLEAFEYIGDHMCIPEDEPIQIVTDSAYVSNCFFDKWYLKWRKNSWKNGKGIPIKNQNQWRSLIKLSLQLNILWKHVRGHQGDKWNEYVDSLCTQQIIDAEEYLASGTPNPFFSEETEGISNEMNKQCPICKKAVTKKENHIFHDGKRVHQRCYDASMQTMQNVCTREYLKNIEKERPSYE